MRKLGLLVGLVAAFATIVGAAASGKALAYGIADQPVAQV
jgi:hypothetical protein